MTKTAVSVTPWEGHAKGSRGYRRVLAALALAGVATFAQLYSTQAVLPLMAADLRISAAEAALSISLATVGLAVSVLPWSFVADRIGPGFAQWPSALELRRCWGWLFHWHRLFHWSWDYGLLKAWPWAESQP
ncbi:hypothetical protein StoSoilB13_15720 [Arthrobacter sp. StoSoilB13]|nr:hypothetical protein StoSoilB13_15720 [Arthrobacter sp. StoSoilB13]